MQVLSVGRTAISRTRAAYLQGGLDFALHDEARPGKPKQYEADAEAQITALACSAPPPGAQRLRRATIFDGPVFKISDGRAA